MAGLLGEGWEDPKSAAIMALAGGLLRKDLGGGLLGANQAYGEAKQNGFKQKLMDMQVQNYQSEIEQRKAAIEKQQQLQAMTQRLLGGGSASAAPGQLGSGSFGITPPPQGMSDMPARPAGLGGANLNDIVALHAAGGPDLLNAYKLAREGFERKPGTFYEGVNGGREYIGDPTKGFEMRNGRVGVMPGFTDAQSAITTATELPKALISAGLDPVKVVGEDGAERYVARSQVVGASQPRPVPAPAQRPASGADSDRFAILTQELQRAQASGNAADVASIQREISRLPVSARTASNPSGLATPGFQATPTNAQAAARERSLTEARLPAQATGQVNETWLKTSYEPVVKAGDAANEVLTNVQVARQSMRNMGGTGWGTESKAVGASVLTGLGIAPQNAKLYAANAETFQNAAMSNLQKVLNAASGPQTEGDADRASKTFAQLKNTPQANEFILDVTEAKAQRDAMRARFFQQALPVARQKGDLQEVEREWVKRAPSVFSMPSMKRWAEGIK